MSEPTLKPEVETDAEPDYDAKVAEVFRELIGDRASRLDGSKYNTDTTAAIEGALTSTLGAAKARDIAFHLTDWTAEAAFIVALQLYPDRFTEAEIAAGIESFLNHVPNHTATAAVLYGVPPEDIFDDAPATITQE